MSYQKVPQEPYPPPGYGSTYPPPGYPSAPPAPGPPPPPQYEGYAPPPPPPAYPYPAPPQPGYQGYFSQGYPAPPPPPPPHPSLTRSTTVIITITKIRTVVPHSSEGGFDCTIISQEASLFRNINEFRVIMASTSHAFCLGFASPASVEGAVELGFEDRASVGGCLCLCFRTSLRFRQLKHRKQVGGMPCQWKEYVVLLFPLKGGYIEGPTVCRQVFLQWLLRSFVHV
ncbi:hypothetical protein Acr_02g0014430 [Actinidia rufa]|uniref:Proline-rich family protein n=1 Tax=Actinidia rufa TaxID=165716 RepID=A0A7J0E9Q7_9ERIC|nr:hypothetical protein Acr_02g0014430 [Actinidia rufa]